MRNPILLFLFITLAFPCLVLAEVDKDLRFKLGSAAGSDRIQIENTVGHGPDDYGANAQVEVVLNRHPKWDTTTRFIMALGLFYRQHTGEIQNLSIPVRVDYSAIGMSIAPGLRLKINDTWNTEGKIEVGIGYADTVTLDSPGVDWNAMKKDDYTSLSPIVGCYYLFDNSASRLGIEIGYQKFWGDFKILSNNGNWPVGTVSGKNYTANIIYGIQF